MIFRAGCPSGPAPCLARNEHNPPDPPEAVMHEDLTPIFGVRDLAPKIGVSDMTL